MPYTNEYPITSADYPYTRVGSLSYSDVDQNSNPSSYHGGHPEDLYYLTGLVAGQTILFSLDQDTQSTWFVIFDDATSYSAWLDFRCYIDFTVGSPVANTGANALSPLSHPTLTDCFVNFAMVAIPGGPVRTVALWTVPPGTTSAIVSVGSDCRSPDDGVTVVDPGAYTFTATLQPAAAAGNSNVAY